MSLIYRGTSSDDVHFNVTERRVYNAPAFDVTGIEVPGRSGDVLNSQERFKNKSIVYTGFIRSSDFPGDTTWERLSRGLRTIKAWVCGDAGKYHDLTDDYDPGFVRRAFVSGETAISEVLDRPDGATITITFMAEPFMYEESDPIELPETGTASGAIASFEGADNAPLKSLIFGIEPIQSGSGDPSPSNIRPISGWTQVDGGINAENFFDKNAITSGKYLDTVTGLPVNAAGYVVSDYMKVWAGRTVYIPPTNTARRWFYDNAKNPVTYLNNSSGQAYTPPADGFIRLSIKNDIDLDTFQVTFGTAASPYHAYQGTPITIALGQTVYGGTVDALNGKLTIDKAMVDMSSLTWTKVTNPIQQNENGTYYTSSTMPVVFIGWNDAGDGDVICSGLKKKSGSGTDVPEAGTIWWNSAGTALRANWGLPNGGSSLEEFTAFLSTYNIAVVGTLATPIEVDLTPVSGLTSLLGQNNIWANTGDTEVVYVEPTENPTEWPSKPRLEITMAGAGTLTVNGKTWSIGSYTGTLICDSEIMDWYDASTLKNSLVSGDGFPELVPGENVITYTGGITKVVAKPRWRTL